jgi:hypothetical protein
MVWAPPRSPWWRKPPSQMSLLNSQRTSKCLLCPWVANSGSSVLTTRDLSHIQTELITGVVPMPLRLLSGMDAIDFTMFSQLNLLTSMVILKMVSHLLLGSKESIVNQVNLRLYQTQMKMLLHWKEQTLHIFQLLRSHIAPTFSTSQSHLKCWRHMKLSLRWSSR